MGHLQLSKAGNPAPISADGPVQSFTQADVNNGERARCERITKIRGCLRQPCEERGVALDIRIGSLPA